MNKLTTNGVTVGVEVEYAPHNSKPEESRYTFGYEVTIINESSDPIQILRRHWRIFDTSGERREIKGVGVIGEQPILYPGRMHRYSSWCPLDSMLGQMWGTFTIINLKTSEEFEVEIPKFEMSTPAKMN